MAVTSAISWAIVHPLESRTMMFDLPIAAWAISIFRSSGSRNSLMRFRFNPASAEISLDVMASADISSDRNTAFPRSGYFWATCLRIVVPIAVLPIEGRAAMHHLSVSSRPPVM